MSTGGREKERQGPEGHGLEVQQVGFSETAVEAVAFGGGVTKARLLGAAAYVVAGGAKCRILLNTLKSLAHEYQLVSGTVFQLGNYSSGDSDPMEVHPGAVWSFWSGSPVVNIPEFGPEDERVTATSTLGVLYALQWP